MELYILVILIIAVILIFVFCFNKDHKMYGKGIRRNLWDKYKNDTIGTFDHTANDIMKTFIPNPNITDFQNNFAVAATLINNIIRNEDYDKTKDPLAMHKLTNMAHHYNNIVIQGLDQAEDLTNVPVNYIVNTIEDFENDYMRNNNRVGRLLNPGVNNIIPQNENGGNNDDINPDIQRVLFKSMKSKKKAATKKAKNKIEKINNAIKRSTRITSDPQNVHDSQLSKELRKQYEIIKHKNSLMNINNNRASPSEIYEYIAKSKLSDSTKQNAIKTLDWIKKSNANISKLNDREVNILMNTWIRAKDTNNSDAIDSFVNSLSDCVEHNNVVCATGRTSRILSSLLYFDKDIEPVKTKDMYNKEIMDKAGYIIDKEVELHSNNATSKFNKAARAYKDPKVQISDEEFNQFSKMLLDKANNIADEYKGIINDKEIRKIKQNIACFIE